MEDCRAPGLKSPSSPLYLLEPKLVLIKAHLKCFWDFFGFGLGGLDLGLGLDKSTLRTRLFLENYERVFSMKVQIRKL